jgi:hypothetical protein
MLRSLNQPGRQITDVHESDGLVSPACNSL